jgi:hypothetical protein
LVIKTLNYVLRTLRLGNAVSMPEKKVARLRKVIDAETPHAGRRASANPVASRAIKPSLAAGERLRKLSEGARTSHG